MASSDRPVIDVDHPDFAPARDAIEDHSNIARFYENRPPYLPGFFTSLAEKLGLNSEMTLLDLCCGRGELAAGLAEHVGHIDAVDGSAAMIEHAMAIPRTTFHVADVNTASLASLGRCDHIVVGSAIHWVRTEALAALIAQNLKDRGAIVVTHRFLDFSATDYGAALGALNAQFGDPVVAVPMEGRQKLARLGFASSDGITAGKTVDFNLKFLYFYQLSKAYCEFYDRIVPDPRPYLDAFRETLAPFARGDRLSARLVNWALIYRAKPA